MSIELDHDWPAEAPPRNFAEILDYRSWIKTGVVPPYSFFAEHGLIDDSEKLFLRGDHIDAYSARTGFIKEFGFAIPCSEAIEALVQLSPLVEVCAGTGGWSAILAKNGATIVATDVNARRKSDYGFQVGANFPVERRDAAAAIRRYRFRNVLAVWPSYSAEWMTLAAHHIRPGMHLALVSEGRGGCVGADSLFDFLESDFEQIASIKIPVFSGMHDCLDIHRRKRP